MAHALLKGLVIRTGVLQGSDGGHLYACDPAQEEEGIPHAIQFVWTPQEGLYERGRQTYNVHTACMIQVPAKGLVNLAGSGAYSAHTVQGSFTGDVFEVGLPKPAIPRYGDFSRLVPIGGAAHAIGHGGMVYRLSAPDSWTRIDEGLPDSANLEAADGFSLEDIYVAGLKGEFWHLAEQRWVKRDLPTNVNLSAIKCAGDGWVYVAGSGGVLLRGREDSWTAIEQTTVTDEIWDLEWFKGALYASTISDLYRLVDDEFEAVDFGDDKPESCYQLDAIENLMWSIGEFDVMAFDGSSWTRIV